MTCSCCKTAREFLAYPMFDPACLHCGARLIQTLGQLPRPRQEIVTRRQAVLADWVAHGHSEAEIRRLVKGPLALGQVGPLACDPRPSTKLRSRRKRSLTL